MKKSLNILEDQAVAGFVQEQLNRKAVEQAEAISTIASKKKSNVLSLLI